MSEVHNNHEHKDCSKLLGTLSEYVDGELSDELCAVLEKHMQDCEDCRIVVDTLRKTVYLYHKSTEKEAIPAYIRRRLFESLELEEFVEK
jgi:anti-sigma factor (TIGR02949 family)